MLGGGWGGGACVCVCGSPVPIGTGPILDENLAWHMLPATAGMKYVGSMFIVGKISTGGRCTICKDEPGRTQIDRDVLHMSTSMTMVFIKWTGE